MLFVFLALHLPSRAQEMELNDSLRNQPYLASDISTNLNRSLKLVNAATENNIGIGRHIAVAARVDSLVSQFADFMEDSIWKSLDNSNIRELEKMSESAGYFEEEIAGLRENLSKDAKNIGSSLEDLDFTSQRWKLTVSDQDSSQIEVARVQRISRLISQLDSIHFLLYQDLEIINGYVDLLSEMQSKLALRDNQLAEQRRILGERFFTRDSPNLINDLQALEGHSLLPSLGRQLGNTFRSDYRIMRSGFTVQLILISIFFLVLYLFASWYKKHLAQMISIEKFELSEIHLTTVYSPLVSTVFLTALLVRLIWPDLPTAFRSLNMVIMMVPMTIILIRLYGSLVKSWLLVLITVYVLTKLYELTYDHNILLRLVLLLFSLSTLSLFVWMIVMKPLGDRFRNRFLYSLFRVLLMGFSILLFIAILGNFMGAFGMAEYFTLTAIQVVTLAIGVKVTIHLADTLIFLLLASNQAQKLNVIRDEMHIIYSKTIQWIGFLLWVFFVVNTLSILRLKDAFFEWGTRVLTTGWKVGEVSITPASIFILVFVIWLSLFLTKIVRHILEKDVFQMMKVDRGSSSTIIMLVRIGLISAGFLLAAAAAGMKLTNLSIVIGAFSVGIGFGLQNIFNNMVSGLILAFEKPIKVGDTVQVDDLLGEVLAIGLRSSRVRSFDGAEVIVPNGNLISNQMINWTLTDAYRRMDIRVGVAYGTKPQIVLELMEDAAMDNRQVNKYPAPRAYFIGFGDSALNFRLLAWTNIENRFPVESDLYVDINDRLDAAGIKIPFPQRDIHIQAPGPAEGGPTQNLPQM